MSSRTRPVVADVATYRGSRATSSQSASSPRGDAFFENGCMIDSALRIHAFRWKQLMGIRNDASPRPGPRAYGVDALLMSRPAPRAVTTFHGAFRCKDIGIGEAAAAMVVHAEQHAAVDRFGSPN